MTAAVILALRVPASAKVTRLVIEKRESPAYQGRTFGKAGQYEILMGHVFGELDPSLRQNAVINDIKLAPRNARGMVEYSATFAIAKPIDTSKASGVLIPEPANRGRGCPDKIREENCQHHVFAYNDGHIGATNGWQGDIGATAKGFRGDDLADAQNIVVPVAKNPDGSRITGPVVETSQNPAARQYLRI